MSSCETNNSDLFSFACPPETCTLNPRYEPVSTSRWQPGDSPHHFLEACGREWENRTTSEGKRRSQTRSCRRVRQRKSCRQPTMSPPPAPFVGLITGIYCMQHWYRHTIIQKVLWKYGFKNFPSTPISWFFKQEPRTCSLKTKSKKITK